jgi:hypothetical protein
MASVIVDSNQFAHAASTVLGAAEANACIDAGADVALLWIRPEFHSSKPSLNSASVQTSQSDH